MNTQRPRIEGKHQIVVRLPVRLHERLVRIADKRGLSVNAQVIDLIEQEVTERPEKAAA